MSLENKNQYQEYRARCCQPGWGVACLALKLTPDPLVSNLDAVWCIESTFAQLRVSSTGKGEACEG